MFGSLYIDDGDYISILALIEKQALSVCKMKPMKPFKAYNYLDNAVEWEMQ